MTANAVFWDQVRRGAALRRPRIAFGLATPEQILTSLRRALQIADLVVVGNSGIANVAGFDLVIADHPDQRIAKCWSPARSRES